LLSWNVCSRKQCENTEKQRRINEYEGKRNGQEGKGGEEAKVHEENKIMNTLEE